MCDVILDVRSGGAGHRRVRRAATAFGDVWFLEGDLVIAALGSEARQADVRASLHKELLLCEGERMRQRDFESVRHYKLAHVLYHRLTLPCAKHNSDEELGDCHGVARCLADGRRGDSGRRSALPLREAPAALGRVGS